MGFFIDSQIIFAQKPPTTQVRETQREIRIGRMRETRMNRKTRRILYQ